LNRYIQIVICVFVFFQNTYAQDFEFTENKGQWHNDVRFKGELRTGAFFLKQGGYRVLQYQSDDFEDAISTLVGHPHKHGKKVPKAAQTVLPSVNEGQQKDINVRSHAYDVSFEGANPKVSLVPEREMVGYANYFLGNDPTKWASGVKTFGTIVYKNMYPGIDVRYYSDNGFLKYDIVVYPGANPKQISLVYEGVDKLLINKGELIVKTSVTEVRERSPYSYQLTDGVRRQVDCRYILNDNKVSFALKGYDPNAVLVIDPTLVFSTFTGSTTDNWGYTATYDAAGNAYGGGIAFGSGFPTTLGAFQRNFGGGSGGSGQNAGFDIVLMKLTPGGTQRIFSTYLGGSSNEQPHSLIVDGGGNLIVAGRTTSSNFPQTNGGKIGIGGGWDIIVTKFNAAGSDLIGSVQIGGALDDGLNIKDKVSNPAGPRSLFQNYGDDARSEVLVDAAGNVFVASCTQSNDFPTTPGAFQAALRGPQDGVLLKFNPAMALQFSTLIGGSGDDAAYVLNLEEDGHIMLAGGTSSNDFPGDKTGTVGSTYQGGIADGFIARMNSTGSNVLKSVYIGSVATDQIYGIQKDKNDFVYIAGTSTGSMPVQNAAFNQPGGKQFIMKLANDFSAYVYATVFGPNTPTPNISPIAFLVDRCENVYMSGWGGLIGDGYINSGTNNLPVTPDAIDNTTDGKDFYFFVLEKDAASQLYGTFFGQQDPIGSGIPDHVDGGTSRFDPRGVIYQGICANCSSGQFPTTPGVVAPNKPQNICNLAVVKIAFELSGVFGGIKSSIDGVDGDTSACAPTIVQFRDTIAMGQSYIWNFGDGTPDIITSEPNIDYAYNTQGNFRVRLITVDDSQCFPRDTSYVNIRVRTDRVTVNALATKIDPCESNQYRFDNLSAQIPSKPFSNSSFTWLFGDNSAPVTAGLNSVTHQFPASGTYTVRLVLTDTNYCNAPDTFSIVLRVSPQVIADFETDPQGCAPYSASFNNTSAGGQSFLWDFGNGTFSSDINPVAFYPVPGTYRVKLIATDPTTCNFVDSSFFTINVRDKPQALFTFSPNPAEENIITTFTNLSQPATMYKWLFGDGDSLITIRRDTIVRHQFRQTDDYLVCLITFNDLGCSDTLCQDVPAIINPALDVVTAFTPNNDGVNDRAVVYGFGVAKLNFRIYNRLGQLMFETNDTNLGWDGMHKGKPQPMDAYAYTLEAELFSGEKVRRAGSITLIR
jgi:gliding motility-associated-like protein